MSDIEKRKEEHIKIALDPSNQYKKSTMFEFVELPYRALPEVNFEEIDLKAKFLDKEFSYPIMISGMTGGFSRAKEINVKLALFAEEKNIPFGVGSQRAMVVDKSLTHTYDVKREAPNVFLVGNIGGAQLLEYDINVIEDMVSSIEADALAVHLNPLQEVIQPEGDRNWKGVLEKIIELKEHLSIPVYVKEVGAGLDPLTAYMLSKEGIEWFDVQGKGGTSWSKVEYKRGNAVKGFEEWGIPTAVSILLLKNYGKVVGSGGIRNGIDVAKAIALGSHFSAAAFPFLKALMLKKLDELFSEWVDQLRVALMLSGCRSVYELRGKAIINPFLNEMVEAYKRSYNLYI